MEFELPSGSTKAGESFDPLRDLTPKKKDQLCVELPIRQQGKDKERRQKFKIKKEKKNKPEIESEVVSSC